MSLKAHLHVKTFWRRCRRDVHTLLKQRFSHDNLMTPYIIVFRWNLIKKSWNWHKDICANWHVSEKLQNWFDFCSKYIILNWEKVFIFQFYFLFVIFHLKKHTENKLLIFQEDIFVFYKYVFILWKICLILIEI